jgi:hypothetical protein
LNICVVHVAMDISSYWKMDGARPGLSFEFERPGVPPARA